MINSELEHNTIKGRRNAGKHVYLIVNATITFIPLNKIVMQNGVPCTETVMKQELQPVMEERLKRKVLQFYRRPFHRR